MDYGQGGESQVSEDTAHRPPGSELATVDQERYPVPDPGLEEHLPRLTDVDEKAAKRATRQVAMFFGLVPILSIGFVVVYFAVPGDAWVDFGPLRANSHQCLLPRLSGRQCLRPCQCGLRVATGPLTGDGHQRGIPRLAGWHGLRQ